jgi:hypothetical protein
MKININNLFQSLFSKYNIDYFYLKWFEDYRTDPKMELICGKNYSKDKVYLFFEEATNDKLNVQFKIGQFVFRTIDSEYLYVESNENKMFIDNLFKDLKLKCFSSKREEIKLHIFDELK